MKLPIVYEFLLSRTTETDSGQKALAMKNTHTYACCIILEAIVTVMATLIGRKRRQEHNRLYSKLAFCDKNDELVAPCWKTSSENLTAKTAAVLCNVLLFNVL